MAILSGRFGKVMYDATPTSPINTVELASISGWTLSLKTDYEDVTTFGKTNRVYVPGMRDISGSVTGFWDSSELTLVQASGVTTPGFLQLEPNETESSFNFAGLAYMDCDINCSMAAPKITGTFKAAGSWTTP